MKTKAVILSCLVSLVLCLSACGTQRGDGAEEAVPEESPAETSAPTAETSTAADVQAVSPPEEVFDREAPAYEWKFDTPENHGMDSAYFSVLHSALEGTQVYAVLTVKDGYVVDEYYREGYDEASVFPLNSCSKSFTSALVGVAIDEGLIAGVDVPISEYFPQVLGTDKEDITIRQVLEHTSGIDWNEFGGDGRSFFELNSSDNWVSYVLGRPMAAPPGATFNYSTGGTHMLAAILEQAVEGTLLDYANDHLFTPLGMDSVLWRADPQGILDGGNGIEMTVRDAAKFGLLFLQNGSWEGRQLIPQTWVAQSTGVQVARSGNYGSYGYQWWIRPFAGFDTYYAMGAFGQFILVVPELDLVTVITSDRTGGTDAPYVYISDYILAAYRSPGDERA